MARNVNTGAKIRRVMLIIPPYIDSVKTLGGSPTSEEVVFPPLQLGYIGTELKKHGIAVEIVCKPSGPWDDIKDALETFRPDMVGFSCHSYTFKSALDGANLVKYILPKAYVTFGGHHICRENATDILRLHPNVDFLVIGEGEHTARELVQRINNGQGVEGCDGLIFRDDSQIVHNAPRRVEMEIGKFNIDYSLLDLTRLPTYYDRPESEYTYIGKRFNLPQSTRMALLITSRGCVGNCKFCSAPRTFQTYRTRDPKAIADEIQCLHREYGFSYFHFSSATFPQHNRKDKELLREIIRRRLDINWSAQSRGDHFDDELIGLIRDSGCINLNFGVESGSPELIHILGKKRDNEKLKATMIQCAKQQIPVAGSFLHNFPGSTRKQYLETLKFIWDISEYGCFAHGHRMWIEINTDIYDMAKETGCIIDHNYWETPLLRSPRFNAPTKEELHSFVGFILFMRIAFHIRQFGNFIDKRSTAIVETEDPWRCRFFIELLAIGFNKHAIPVYTTKKVLRQVKEVLLPDELVAIEFRKIESLLSKGTAPALLVVDEELASDIQRISGKIPSGSMMTLRSKDYPRGGLSEKGESIEKGVWDYETDDLVDITLIHPKQEPELMEATHIGVLLQSPVDIAEKMEQLKTEFPGADIGILCPDVFLPHVVQTLKMRRSVDYVQRSDRLRPVDVTDEEQIRLEGLQYDVLVVFSESARHRDHRDTFAFIQKYLPGHSALGLANERWFVIGWQPINETWFHFRLRS